MNLTTGISGASSLSSSMDWGLKGCKTVGRLVFWSVPQNVHGRFLVRSVRWLAVGSLLIAAAFADAMIKKHRQEQKVIGPADKQNLPLLDKALAQGLGVMILVYAYITYTKVGLTPECENTLLELWKSKSIDGWAHVGREFLTQVHRCSELVSLNPSSTNASQTSIDFLAFIQKLASHFEDDEAIPVMIDNGKFVCAIFGVQQDNGEFFLDIGECTLSQRATALKLNNYYIRLSKEGTLLNSDGNQWSGGDFCAHSHWKVLFPKRSIRMILKESPPPSSGDIEAGVEQP